jgi:hypothetical protein
MAKNVLDVLKDKIEDEKSSALHFLGNGGAKDFASYKEVTGMVRGLETCMNYVEDLSRNMDSDDDD